MGFKKWELTNGKAKRVISDDLVLEIDCSNDIFCSLLGQKIHFCKLHSCMLYNDCMSFKKAQPNRPNED